MCSNAARVLDLIEWPEEPAAFWMPAAAAVLELPERLTVSEWCDRYRVLSAKTTAQPGPWRTSKVPFSREILDAWADPYVEQLTFLASTQVSKTETMLNCLAYSLDQDPAGALFVLPTDPDAKKLCTKRVTPMIQESPRLHALTTGNPDHMKTNEIELKRSTVFFGSSRSASQLASMPIRYLFFDETDKFERATAGGREANPISLARERTRTFYNRKIFAACTPTLEDGYINTEFMKGTQERYYVPCPHCDQWQTLEFAAIVWPQDARDPERVKAERLASYFCPACGEEIPDREKAAMLERGRWVSEKYEAIDPATGEISGARPTPTIHRSFTVNALYSPWLTWSEIAAEFLASKDDPTTLQNFINSWLAQVWKEKAETPELSTVLALKCDLAPMVAPARVRAITCGIDVQRAGFYFAVWAFTETLESWCIHYGYATTWAEIEELLFATRFQIEGSDKTLPIWRAAIDTGGTAAEEEGELSRTEEVYNWLRGNTTRLVGLVNGVKGASRSLGQRVRHSLVDVYPGREKRKIIGGLHLWLMDTADLKQVFNWRMTRGHEQAQGIHLHAATETEFALHLVSEERRRNPRTRKWEWVKKRKRNDWFDASLYAHACADPQWSGGVRAAPTPEFYEPRPPAGHVDPNVNPFNRPPMKGRKLW